MSVFDEIKPRKKDNLYDADMHMMSCIDGFFVNDECPVNSMLSVGGNCVTITLRHVFLYNAINNVPFVTVVKGDVSFAKH